MPAKMSHFVTCHVCHTSESVQTQHSFLVFSTWIHSPFLISYHHFPSQFMAHFDDSVESTSVSSWSSDSGSSADSSNGSDTQDVQESTALMSKLGVYRCAHIIPVLTVLLSIRCQAQTAIHPSTLQSIPDLWCSNSQGREAAQALGSCARYPKHWISALT